MQTDDPTQVLRRKAAKVLGSKKTATRWFREPAIGLNGQRPIDLSKTEEGREQVSTYLDQIEYGVYV